jgi:thiol:disulfide interchange protein DsbA
MFQGYIKNILALGIVVLLASTSVQAVTSSKDSFVEGKDYLRIPTEIRNSPEVKQLLSKDPSKVQVVFFFSYGCHACEVVHTPFEKWAAEPSTVKNKNLTVYRYPVAFNPQWRMLAKLYYTMESLDTKGKLNNAIFEGIHKQGVKLWQQDEMSKFFVRNGYSAKDFNSAFTSFSVNRLTKQAEDVSTAYKVTETPDLIVNGPIASYRVSVVAAAGNIPRLFQVLDYLVKRETKLLDHG